MRASGFDTAKKVSSFGKQEEKEEAETVKVQHRESEKARTSEIDAATEVSSFDEQEKKEKAEPAEVLEKTVEFSHSFGKKIADEFVMDDDYEEEYTQQEEVAQEMEYQDAEPGSGDDRTTNRYSHGNSKIDSIIHDTKQQDGDIGMLNKLGALWQKSNEMMEEFDEHPIESLRSVGGWLAAKAVNQSKMHGLRKIAKTGTIVHSGDFTFIKQGSSLMLYRYLGASRKIEIPAYVGKLPVVSLYPDFLNAGVFQGGMRHSYTVNSIKSAYKGSTLDAVNELHADGVLHGITQVVLPSTVKALYGKVFSGCKELKVLVVPSSVIAFSNDVVKGSGITTIYFNGVIPKDFNVEKFNGKIFRKVSD